VAIDPVAMLLHGRLLDIYYLIHNPHVPSIQTIEEVLNKATSEERATVGSRAKVMIDYGTAVQKVVSKTVPKAAAHG
jgi:hypothetical protein